MLLYIICEITPVYTHYVIRNKKDLVTGVIQIDFITVIYAFVVLLSSCKLQLLFIIKYFIQLIIPDNRIFSKSLRIILLNQTNYPKCTIQIDCYRLQSTDSYIVIQIIYNSKLNRTDSILIFVVSVLLCPDVQYIVTLLSIFPRRYMGLQVD